jgi:hypothetical protein
MDVGRGEITEDAHVMGFAFGSTHPTGYGLRSSAEGETHQMLAKAFQAVVWMDGFAAEGVGGDAAYDGT